MATVVDDLLTVIATYTVPSVTNELITIDKSIAYTSAYVHSIALWKNKVAVELRGMIFTDDAIRAAAIPPSTVSQTWYTYHRLINKREYGRVGSLDKGMYITQITGVGTGLILVHDDLFVATPTRLLMFTRPRVDQPFVQTGSVSFGGAQVIDIAYSDSYKFYYLLTERNELYRLTRSHFVRGDVIPVKLALNVVYLYQHYYPTRLDRGKGVVDIVGQPIVPPTTNTVIYDQLNDGIYTTYTGAAYIPYPGAYVHVYRPNTIFLKRAGRSIDSDHYAAINGDVYISDAKIVTKFTYLVPVIDVLQIGRRENQKVYYLHANGEICDQPDSPIIKLLGNRVGLNVPVIY